MSVNDASKYDQTGVMNEAYTNITVGIVVDTNDPQQMGRVRAHCPALGDDYDSDIEDLPWCSYATPFGGSVGYGPRGSEDSDDYKSRGPVSYGMWAIPKVGAQVLVMCVDGNPLYRIWLGCLFGEQSPHTLPHGRFSYQDNSEYYATGKPEGPFTSYEEPIQPLYDNMKEGFGSNRNGNYEFQSRGADFQAAAITKDEVEFTTTTVSDDEDETYKGKKYRQGYRVSRLHPEVTYDNTVVNYDSYVYSITSPGFHSFSMDDRPENCRMKFRTTAGHQIILDDTNERVYINTAKGNCWIELDQNGNIDIFSDRRVSVRAKKDINFTTDETFRVHAKKGIFMYSDDEMRLHTQKDIHVRTEQNLRTHSKLETFIEADNNINLYTSQQFKAYSSSQMHLKSDADMKMTGGPNIHFNGPPATKATKSSEQLAFWTNRVPDHEPWARVLMKDDTKNLNHAPQFEYDSDNVGKIEGSDTIERGTNWRR